MSTESAGAPPLDDVDRAIIELLRKDGRATSRAIAASIGIAETKVTARIRTLLADQALAITTIFDWQQVGYQHDLWLKIRSDAEPAALARTIASIKGVHAVLRVQDPYDLLVHVLVPHQENLAQFLTTELAGTPGLAEVETAVTLQVVKWSVTIARLPLGSSYFDFPNPQVELDDLDHATLSTLAKDGRQSNRQIARDLGVNEGTIRARIRRMESSGMLRICGQLNSQLASPSATRSITSVRAHPSLAESIGRRASDLPGVNMISVVTGRYNLLLVGSYDNHTQMRDTLGSLRCLPGVHNIQNSVITDIVALDYHLARFIDEG